MIVEGKDINYDKSIKYIKEFIDVYVKSGKSVSLKISARSGKLTGKQVIIDEPA